MLRIIILLFTLFLCACGNSSTGEQTVGTTPGQTTTNNNTASPTPTPARNPSVLVANRGDGTVSVVDTTTDQVTDTITLPASTNPARPSYVLSSSTTNRIYVGDDANSRISVFSSTDLSHLTDLSTVGDAFHMWLNNTQLWVVDRAAKSLVVFDLSTNSRLAVVPVPADLVALGGEPHDVVIDSSGAYVTVSEVTGQPDVLVKYDLGTFQEVSRANVGEDPHVILSPINRHIYVACQVTNNVFVFNRDNLNLETVIPVLGGHGVWVPPNGQSLYVTNFASHVVGGLPGPGGFGLFGIDLGTNTVNAELTLPTTGPHNLVCNQDGSKLYLTHSNGGNSLSVFDISAPTGIPQFERTVSVGRNPFGIAFLP